MGLLIQVVLTGNTGRGTPVMTRLEQPTAVAVGGDTSWVAEGQPLRLFGLDPTPAKLPFLVRRAILK